MKKTIILFLLLFSNFYFSQTIEDEVSEKACQCVQQKLEKDKTILKNEISNCISQSLDDVLKTKSEKEAKKYMKNMNAFIEKMRIIYKKVSDRCLNELKLESN